MIQIKKTNKKKIVSLVLVLSLLASSIIGCGEKADTATREVPSAPQSTEEQLVDQVAKQFVDELIIPDTTISTDWHDYVGDLDAFVYGCIGREFQLSYKVFNAAVELDDGDRIFGLGYTDYADYYEASAEKRGYFPAGFIGLIGEEKIPTEYIENGLEIIDVDTEDDYGFVLAYDTEPFMEHCVIWGQYLQFGVGEDGNITYKTQEYERGYCDEALGALYSYDEGRLVFNPDVGDFVPLSGGSLYSEIDYAALETEVNRILENQDEYFSEQKVRTAVYIAKEAIDNYFLSIQSEEFMGFDVKELIEISSQIDPMECIRFTDEGYVIIDADSAPPEEATAFVKWTVGITCGVIVAGTVAVDFFIPVLAPLAGTISGAATEAFMEVLIENKAVKDVNWTKVGVAAFSGAMFAWACPQFAAGVTKMATTGTAKVLGQKLSEEAIKAIAKTAGYGALAGINGLNSGATSAAFAYLDGKSDEEILNAFKLGAILGVGCTMAASAGTELALKGMSVIEESKPNNWLIKLSEKSSEFIGNHQIKLIKKENSLIENILIPKSVHEAAEEAMYQYQMVTCGDKVLANKINKLPSDKKDFCYYDLEGNLIKKSQLYSNGGNAILKPSKDCASKVSKVFAEHNVTEIEITKGIPDFSPVSEGEFLPKEITSNRGSNMASYRKQLANEWNSNPDAIPIKIKESLSDEQIEHINAKIVGETLSELGLTLHESVDGKVYIVDSAFHEIIKHYGGVALAKAREKIVQGVTYFSELSNSPCKAVWGTIISREASANG